MSILGTRFFRRNEWLSEVKILTYNVNGIRAALNKGLAEWLAEENADILCMQEIKATAAQIPQELFEQMGYHCYWAPAEKKGYSGVGVLTRQKPIAYHVGMGIDRYDQEGRVQKLIFSDFTLLNTYFPSGTTGQERQNFKMEFLADFSQYTQTLQAEGQQLVICGDVNICHKEIDIHNPVSNKNTSGFLPEERTWVTEFLSTGFLDAFRLFHETPHRYTWWTYRAGARERNLGWRIDYFFVSEMLKNLLKDCRILDQVKHSDHCPVCLETTFNMDVY